MRWLFNNLGLKILSLTLALIFTTYIYYEVDYPIPETVFLPLEVRNLSSELVLLEKPPSSVEVQIRGPYRSISHLNTQDHPAVIDFSNTSGPGPVSVDIEMPSLGDVVITSQASDRLMLTVDMVSKQNFPLVIWHTGDLNPAFYIASERSASGSVTVEGPKQVVEKIGIARIEPDLGRLSAGIESSGDSIEAKLQVRLYDAESRPLENGNLGMSPEKVDYRLELAPIGDFKVLRVVPHVIGEPAPGCFLAAVEPDPRFIPVLPGSVGPDDFAVRTEVVDTSGAKSDFDRRVKLIYGNAQATDTARIEECVVHCIVQRLDRQANEQLLEVSISNADPALEYILVPSMLRISQIGSGSEALRLGREVSARLDVAGLGQGVYQVSPQLNLPINLDAARISPPTIRLTVLKRGKESQ